MSAADGIGGRNTLKLEIHGGPILELSLNLGMGHYSPIWEGIIYAE
jgi:hypothetical protein